MTLLQNVRFLSQIYFKMYKNHLNFQAFLDRQNILEKEENKGTTIAGFKPVQDYRHHEGSTV